MGGTDTGTILASVTKFRTISHRAYKLKVGFVVKFDFSFSSMMYV